MISSELIRVDHPSKIDRLAMVGAVPGRQIADLTLRIGPRSLVRSFTVIYAGSVIGSDLETGHGAVVREENRIGDGLSLWNHSTVDYGCVIGDRVRIHCNVYVAQFTVLEDDVFLAPGVGVANDKHPICTVHMKGPVVKRRARVGVNATLLPEIVIGEDALIGAGAVVTKDVPPRAIVVGNPARIVGTIDSIECPHRVLGEAY